MASMFANLTSADFGGTAARELRAAKRKQVHMLFDQIQIAIHNNDRATVESLLAKLACATANKARAS